MDNNSCPELSSDRQQACKQPILVTGAHRSGTTWVGKMLTVGGQAAYISEPLNVWHRPGVMRVPTKHWYTYITAQNDADYLPALQDTLRFRYHAWAEIKSIRSMKDLLRMSRDGSIFLSGRLRQKRALIKDPFAVFSAPWFYHALGCQVVITIRHPAAFASSLKRLSWPFDFRDLLSQSLLMKDYLEPFRAEMEKMVQKEFDIHLEKGDRKNRKSQSPCDIIENSSLLWRAIYSVVKDYSQRFSCFKVVRHEDLSINPSLAFRTLYNELNLQYTTEAERIITMSSSSENPKELPKHRKYYVRLDSRSNLGNWKHRLSREEIYQIRSFTEELAGYYYPEMSWD